MNLIVGNFYWMKSKNTHHNIAIGVENDKVTIGEYIGESNFIPNMSLFYVVGIDTVQDLEDWKLIRAV
mgnify:CR=1 FL=1